MITVFGSINVDLVTRVKRIPSPGETVQGSDYSLIAGGKGANQALAARRGGAEVRMVGAVGNDFFSPAALRELEADGVDLSAVARRDGTNGLAVITVEESGENTIVISPGANGTISASSVPEAAYRAGDTFLFQMEVPFRETLEVANRARAAGARPLLSIAPYTPLTAEELTVFDVLLVNEHEAADMARHLVIPANGPQETTQALARQLGRTVITTMGAAGAVAATGDDTIHVPALPVTPVDTTGAGDTFCGVLAALLDEGADMQSAMRKAAIAGSLACAREGAQPSFPRRGEIDAAAAG